VETENDFNWLAQLRYYWEDENVWIRITNARVNYAYEYLGNTGRYVCCVTNTNPTGLPVSYQNIS
jgi:dynein heavy chain